MATWPPTVADVKVDAGIDAADTRDDERLSLVLDAAVAFVQRVRPDYNYTGDPLDDRAAPGADVRLGTMRLAYRWHVRRRSPDGLVAMAELGSARVPGFDPDIEQLLRIGRFARPVVA